MTQVEIPRSIVAEASTGVEEHKRVLGLGSTTALVVGNMIGSGIFLLPASLADLAAFRLWLALHCRRCHVIAMVFSKLSSMVPKVGARTPIAAWASATSPGSGSPGGTGSPSGSATRPSPWHWSSYLGGVIPILGQQLWLSGSGRYRADLARDLDQRDGHQAGWRVPGDYHHHETGAARGHGDPRAILDQLESLYPVQYERHVPVRRYYRRCGSDAVGVPRRGIGHHSRR